MRSCKSSKYCCIPPIPKPIIRTSNSSIGTDLLLALAIKDHTGRRGPTGFIGPTGAIGATGVPGQTGACGGAMGAMGPI
jgi:hypothetical protein